jgi:hypothetical protein
VLPFCGTDMLPGIQSVEPVPRPLPKPRAGMYGVVGMFFAAGAAQCAPESVEV